MITPAISVLSALEGLKQVDAEPFALRAAGDRPHPDRAVSRPATRHAGVAAFFGPIMVVFSSSTRRSA